MNVSQSLRGRINFQGEFDELFADVVKAYDLGSFISFSPIEFGYEDLNVELVTSKGKYFIKIFAETRDNAECLRLINMVKVSIDNEVNHPIFLRSNNGYIFRERYEDFNIRLAVFEFIDGKSFYELKRKPNDAEIKEIIKMAADINKIDYKPAPLSDSWAIVSFPEEYKNAKKLIDKELIPDLDSLLKQFEKVDIKSLPHSLVHGDLISTNIMKAKDKIYCVDFSVGNYYPRIIELAVLMCDILFDPTGKVTLKKNYDLLLSEYQKYIKLTQEELDTLPLFIKIAHAMRIIGGLREKKKGNESRENEYWFELGLKGLKQSLTTWK